MPPMRRVSSGSPVETIRELGVEASRACETARGADLNCFDMASSFARLIAAVSTRTTLVPGDIIVVGGAGPAAPLQRGDRVEVSAAGIGALRNVVAAEDGSG